MDERTQPWSVFRKWITFRLPPQFRNVIVTIQFYLCWSFVLIWGRKWLCDVGGWGRAVLSGRLRRGKHLRRHSLVLLPWRLIAGAIGWTLYTRHSTDCMQRQMNRWDVCRWTERDTVRLYLILTRGASVEVVVVLGDISQDAEAVRNLKCHHVFCIQQRWNSQLFFCNTERLQIKPVLSSEKRNKTLGFKSRRMQCTYKS